MCVLCAGRLTATGAVVEFCCLMFVCTGTKCYRQQGADVTVVGIHSLRRVKLSVLRLQKAIVDFLSLQSHHCTDPHHCTSAPLPRLLATCSPISISASTQRYRLQNILEALLL